MPDVLYWKPRRKNSWGTGIKRFWVLYKDGKRLGTVVKECSDLYFETRYSVYAGGARIGHTDDLVSGKVMLENHCGVCAQAPRKVAK